MHGEHLDRDLALHELGDLSGEARAHMAEHGARPGQARAPMAVHGDLFAQARASNAALGEQLGHQRALHDGLYGHMDTIGPTLWQVVLSLHGDYMIVGVEAPVRFLNMVWGRWGRRWSVTVSTSCLVGRVDGCYEHQGRAATSSLAGDAAAVRGRASSEHSSDEGYQQCSWAVVGTHSP